VTTVAVVLGLQARQESARAIASRDFMLNLFKRADQEKSRGADITAREILDKGRVDLETRLAGQPLLQAELLRGIADIQMSMAEHVHADSTLKDVVRVYESLGMARETAMAYVLRAENAMRMGNLDLADSLLQQARDVPGRPKGDRELNGSLAEVAGWIATYRMDSVRARDLFRESQKEANEAFGPHHLKSLQALRGLIRAELGLHNWDYALVLHGQLEAAAAATPGLELKEMVALDHDRTNLLTLAGRDAQNLSFAQVAEQRCTKALGPNDDTCRRLFLNKTRALSRLGFVERLREQMPQVQALAEDRLAPSMQAEALLVLYRFESAYGTSASAQALSERVRAFGESGREVPVNPAIKAKALLALAEAELRRGDARAALPWIEKVLALRRPGDAPGGASVFQAVARAFMGVARLRQGDPTAALDWMRQSQADFAEALGSAHPQAVLFSLNTALALNILGQVDEARIVVDQAEPVLREALGTDSPAYAKLHRLQRSLRGAAGGGDRARAPSTGQSAEATSAEGTDFFS
jgi:serine/threonine-protein kinase